MKLKQVQGSGWVSVWIDNTRVVSAALRSFIGSASQTVDTAVGTVDVLAGREVSYPTPYTLQPTPHTSFSTWFRV